jgi:molecular chaperone DnaK
MSDDSKPPGDNRRKHPRTPLSLLVQFRFNTFEDFLAEYSMDISPGGMFIRTNEPREEGSMIYLQFSLKDGSKLIEGLGRVVRVNPPGDKNREPGMGVEFVNFDEESSALILEICSTKAAQTKPKN